MQEEVFSTNTKIIRDTDFITKNTADLKVMLETITEDALNYDDDIVEKYFKVVLNPYKEAFPKEQGEQDDKMTSFNCYDCRCRATSKRCLFAHVIFVYSPKVYKCDICPLKLEPSRQCITT